MFKIIKNKVGNKTEYLTEADIKTITRYFEMLDVNKQLKYNAMTIQQYNNALNFEQTIYDTLKELAVPEKQY